jgi:putative ABC transport system substrate-binding protein
LFYACTESEITEAFFSLSQLKADALVIGNDSLFVYRSESLGALTLRHAIPTIHEFRPFVASGGLLSYGSSITDSYRLAGVYTSRILKGEKPADLPVQQSTKVEIIINVKTAKAFGLTIPTTLLATANEIIE